MKKIIINVLQMPDIAVDSMKKVAGMLETHAKDVSAELHEGAVEVVPSAINPDFFIMKTTTTKEEWQAYNDGNRPKLKAWFKENLLDPGLIKVEQVLEMDIE